MKIPIELTTPIMLRIVPEIRLSEIVSNISQVKDIVTSGITISGKAENLKNTIACRIIWIVKKGDSKKEYAYEKSTLLVPDNDGGFSVTDGDNNSLSFDAYKCNAIGEGSVGCRIEPDVEDTDTFNLSEDIKIAISCNCVFKSITFTKPLISTETKLNPINFSSKKEPEMGITRIGSMMKMFPSISSVLQGKYIEIRLFQYVNLGDAVKREQLAVYQSQITKETSERETYWCVGCENINSRLKLAYKAYSVDDSSINFGYEIALNDTNKFSKDTDKVILRKKLLIVKKPKLTKFEIFKLGGLDNVLIQGAIEGFDIHYPLNLIVGLYGYDTSSDEVKITHICSQTNAAATSSIFDKVVPEKFSVFLKVDRIGPKKWNEFIFKLPANHFFAVLSIATQTGNVPKLAFGNVIAYEPNMGYDEGDETGFAPFDVTGERFSTFNYGSGVCTDLVTPEGNLIDLESKGMVDLPDPDKKFVDHTDIQVFAMALWGEARGVCPETRRFIAHSIVNRVLSSRWGNTLKDVLLKPKHYSSFNGPETKWPYTKDANYDKLRKPIKSGGKNGEKIWRLVSADALEAYARIKNNKIKDPSLGADHYYDTSMKKPYWVRNSPNAVLLIQSPGMKEGHFVRFYKNIK